MKENKKAANFSFERLPLNWLPFSVWLYLKKQKTKQKKKWPSKWWPGEGRASTLLLFYPFVISHHVERGINIKKSGHLIDEMRHAQLVTIAPPLLFLNKSLVITAFVFPWFSPWSMFGRRMYDIVILYDNLNDVNAYYTIVDFKAADKGLYVFMNFFSNEWGGDKTSRSKISCQTSRIVID